MQKPCGARTQPRRTPWVELQTTAAHRVGALRQACHAAARTTSDGRWRRRPILCPIQQGLLRRSFPGSCPMTAADRRVEGEEEKMMMRSFVVVGLLASLWTACSSDSSSNCSGMAPAGTTCQKAGGGCEALVCQGSSWTCPAGDTQVALTATSCQGDGGSGGDSGQACSGMPPAGATCQKAGGGCEGLVCQGSSWTCPAGDTQIALTATACQGDGGSSGDSGHD